MTTDIYFATSNPHKWKEAQSFTSIPLKPISIELEELQILDLPQLAFHKAQQAYQIIQKPVFVEDISLCFHAWNQLPGVFIKWFLQELGTAGLLKALEPFQNHRATALCGLAYQDAQQSLYFEGKIEGSIVSSRGSLGFGWDSIFLPDGSTKTLGEMDLIEKREFSMRGRAFAQAQMTLAL